MKIRKIGIIFSAFILSIGSAIAGCPGSYISATAADARANASAACAALGTWDIARLRGGGSIDGPGYGCNIRDSDTRSLGNVLCKNPISFSAVSGNDCGPGLTLVDTITALDYSNHACPALGTWDIAQLAGGGSMDGSGYLCGIRVTDTRNLGTVLCANYVFVEGTGSP